MRDDHVGIVLPGTAGLIDLPCCCWTPVGSRSLPCSIGLLITLLSIRICWRAVVAGVRLHRLRSVGDGSLRSLIRRSGELARELVRIRLLHVRCEPGCLTNLIGIRVNRASCRRQRRIHRTLIPNILDSPVVLLARLPPLQFILLHVGVGEHRSGHAIALQRAFVVTSPRAVLILGVQLQIGGWLLSTLSECGGAEGLRSLVVRLAEIGGSHVDGQLAIRLRDRIVLSQRTLSRELADRSATGVHVARAQTHRSAGSGAAGILHGITIGWTLHRLLTIRELLLRILLLGHLLILTRLRTRRIEGSIQARWQSSMLSLRQLAHIRVNALSRSITDAVRLRSRALTWILTLSQSLTLALQSLRRTGLFKVRAVSAIWLHRLVRDVGILVLTLILVLQIGLLHIVHLRLTDGTVCSRAGLTRVRCVTGNGSCVGHPLRSFTQHRHLSAILRTFVASLQVVLESLSLMVFLRNIGCRSSIRSGLNGLLQSRGERSIGFHPHGGLLTLW